jgi:hypothetical protein
MGELRIISDGTTANTKIIDVVTGDEIKGIISLKIIADAKKDYVHVNMTIKPKKIDVIGYNGSGEDVGQ